MCDRRLPEPAGTSSAARGWRCWGRCCQLALGGGLSLSARSPSRLPSGGWQQQGPRCERGEGARRGRGRGAGRGLCGPSFRSRSLGTHGSRSNSFQINWAGDGGIWPRRRESGAAAGAGAPAGLGSGPALPGTITFSSVFLPPELRTVDFGIGAKCQFASSQTDTILDARCCARAERWADRASACGHAMVGPAGTDWGSGVCVCTCTCGGGCVCLRSSEASSQRAT